MVTRLYKKWISVTKYLMVVIIITICIGMLYMVPIKQALLLGKSCDFFRRGSKGRDRLGSNAYHLHRICYCLTNCIHAFDQGTCCQWLIWNWQVVTWETYTYIIQCLWSGYLVCLVNVIFFKFQFSLIKFMITACAHSKLLMLAQSKLSYHTMIHAVPYCTRLYTVAILNSKSICTMLKF